MLVISERKLTQEEIKKYRDKNYRICYTGWIEEPVVKLGESVGFVMDTFKPQTIRFMERLIYRKTRSPITARINEEVIRVDKENWKSTHYDDKTRRWYSVKNKVLEIYDEQQKIRKQNKEDWKKRKRTEALGKIPEDLDILLNNFAKLYEVDYEPEDTETKLRAYMQIKYYLDNNFEYSRDILGQLPTEESMFECISFGDETYLEDKCYKESA